jgi:hypothetical protein
MYWKAFWELHNSEIPTLSYAQQRDIFYVQGSTLDVKSPPIGSVDINFADYRL